MSEPIHYQCPELHEGLNAPTYGIHSSRPEFLGASVDRNACEHITPEEREELYAGRVPARLVPREAEGTEL
ncbi:hypothetical protein C0216_08790 [Streptomyces globosus]|uniref:Uncharacterized protein n=1 Tax=Streptomyces globosus TaxID=68209 RepID=A0A344TY25_9ACTN|nr:hypothetical protein [Streptomyces globosus]AXE23546.1 hypothetical protein C0216_08790 [Streptomyces globosus]